MSALVAAVLVGAAFLVLNATAALLLVPFARRLERIPIESRAHWRLVLLALPPAVALALLTPPVLRATLGQGAGLADLCRQLHAHCDLVLSEGSAGEAIVYVAAAVALGAASAWVLARLFLPIATATRRTAVLSEPDAARLKAAVGRVVVRTGLMPRVRILPAGSPSAASFGLFSPTVVLSETMVGALTEEELEAVLLHELAHFRARDGLVSVVLGLGRSLSLWPLGGRALWTAYALDREILCDRTALRWGADPLALAGALVKAARLALPPESRPWAAALEGHHKTPLSVRVRLLIDQAGAPIPARSPRSASAWALLLGFVAAGALASGDWLTSMHCVVEDIVHWFV